MIPDKTTHEWLIFSLILLGIWFAIYLIRPFIRKKMLWTSLLTTPIGLIEPLFIPIYWNPPSLFNLAGQTGFDIESLIFSFAIGGIAAVLYEASFNVKHAKMSKKEIHTNRHKFHRLALVSPILIFIPLYLFTSLNPIYSVIISLFAGGIAGSLCRPDLKKKIFVGGILFLVLYFLFFLSINLIFPSFVYVWNLPVLSGIAVVGVPLEELLFAASFGMSWSSAYEHVKWYRLK